MNSLKIMVILLKLIFVAILLVVYYLYFFKDVVENYANRLTNLATKQEPLTNGMETPAITICLSPTRKAKKMEEWNITEQFFKLKTLKTYDNLFNDVSMKDIIDDTSFKLDKDFFIEFGTWNFGTTKIIPLSLGSTTFEGQTITLTEIYTLFQGICYLLKTDFNLSFFRKKLHLSVVMKNSTIESDKPQNVRLILSSKHDALSIVTNKWKNLNYLTVPLEFGKGSTSVDVKESKTSRITECDQTVESFQQCLWLELKRGTESLLEDCGTFCVPMNWKAYFDFFSNQINETTYATCKNLKDESCTSDILFNAFIESLPKCKIQCNYIEYSANVENLDYQYNNYSDMSADAVIYSESPTRTFNKEYLIYDVPGLIGNIGGSLGLFMGISFYGAFSDILEFVLKKLTLK